MTRRTKTGHPSRSAPVRRAVRRAESLLLRWGGDVQGVTAVEYALVAGVTAGLAVISVHFMSDVLASVVVLVNGAIGRIR